MTKVALATLIGSLVFASGDVYRAMAPWCGQAHITGYVRSEGSAFTYDGTPVMNGEPVVAASWDVSMGSLVDIEGLGTFRVADRDMLGWGSPTWIDVAVWTRSEALALTGERNVCIYRPQE